MSPDFLKQLGETFNRPDMLGAIAVAFIGLMGIPSFMRNYTWHNEKTLYNYDEGSRDVRQRRKSLLHPGKDVVRLVVIKSNGMLVKGHHSEELVPRQRK